MGMYLLGLATLPALAALGLVLLYLSVRFAGVLSRRGFIVEAKGTRRVDEIPDWRLESEIFWERPFGPIFVGGWYREDQVWQQPSIAKATRWIGLGRPKGPCLMVMRKRDLGEVLDPTEVIAR